jgi:hypothetical protein
MSSVSRSTRETCVVFSTFPSDLLEKASDGDTWLEAGRQLKFYF